MRGEGYTRDISSTGVYVLTGERLPSGTAVKLDVTLPSLRGRRSGASLRTQGHVVRSEEVGFAASAEMGFRMQLPGRSSDELLVGGNSDSKHEADGKETKDRFVFFVSRPYSA
jgi:hypothetical protein